MIKQDMVIDTVASGVSDDRSEEGVLRMGQGQGITADEQARRRLRSKQPARRSLTDDEAVSRRLKREATFVAIKEEILRTVPERRPDLEQAHKFYASIRTTRSPESTQASRMVEINKLKGGVEKRPWLQADKCSMRVGWTNSTRKSRDTWSRISRTHVIRRLFAAASVTAVGRVVEYKAVLQNNNMFTFDVTSAYTHAWEDGFVFLEPPPEEIEEHGDCVWRSLRCRWASQGCKIVAGAFRRHPQKRA